MLLKTKPEVNVLVLKNVNTEQVVLFYEFNFD